jgi:predicted O-methyltransferase YrrM
MLSIEQVFSEMASRYKALNLTILGGYSNYVFLPINGSQFNFVADSSELKSTSAGIANDEATFLYGLSRYLEPKKILIIGNSYGVSTVFLSLANQDAKVVAIDKFRIKGNQVTKDLLHGLEDKLVIEASTPDDLEEIIAKHLGGVVDFCLVDAVHTNEVQSAEFAILRKYMSNNSIIVFHDVLSTGLLKSFNEIKRDPDFSFHLATKTSSGLGLAIRGKFNEGFDSFIEFFCHPLQIVLNFKSTLNTNQEMIDFSVMQKENFKIPNHPQL